MKQMLINTTRLAAFMVFPFFAIGSSAYAQDTLRIDLKRALTIAFAESPTIKVADKEIKKKQYARKESIASLFPQLNFTTDYNRTLKKQVMYMDMDMGDMGDAMPPGMDTPSMDDGFEVGRSNNWSTGFYASMPLVNASLWKSLSLSATDVELAMEQARSSKISMQSEVKKSYYAVLLANDSYRVFRQSYDNAVENYQDIQRKFDQGVVAEFDLIRADVRVKNTEPNMLQADNARKLAQRRLKALMGVDLDMPIVCEGQLSDYDRNLIGDFLSTDTTLTENSELKQMDLQTKQLQGSLQLRKFDYIPTLSLTGMYQWNAMSNDFKFKNYRWNPYSVVGLSLNIPIFSGGNKYYKIKETKISLEQMELQRDDVQRNLKLAVQQQMDNMKTCVKRYDAARKGVEHAERGYMISQKRYDTGAGTLLEMNDAELSLTQARLNQTQAIYDYMVAKAELEKVLGNALKE